MNILTIAKALIESYPNCPVPFVFQRELNNLEETLEFTLGKGFYPTHSSLSEEHGM